MILRWVIVLALCVTATLVSGKAISKHGDKSPSDSKSDKKHAKEAAAVADSKPGSGDVNLQFSAGKLKGGGGGGGNCTVNCTITFENDDNSLGEGESMNLMEEERKDENSRSDAEKSAKRHDKFESESNGAENEESSGQPDEDKDEDMVEPDTHSGNENSAAVDTKQTSDALSPPKPDVVAAKEGSKTKQVAVTPQSTVQEGSKFPVSDMSNATQHPSMPIPQMIPLPLFYNSGENEGSANGMTSDTKKTSDIDEINGESGYGELFTSNKTEQPQTPEQHEQVSQASPLVNGAAGQPMKKKHNRVHLHAGKKVEVGVPNVAPAVVAKVNPAGDAAPAGANTFAPHVDSALAAAKPGGETTTDYPFVVSDGPKANIHPLRNSKIKMGNDHDEDLVDYYDEDDDNDDSPAVAPLSDEADSSEYSESDSEGESGDSLDNVDTAPKLEDDSNVKQGPEETSGSGSGEAEFSGSDAVEEKAEEVKETKKPKKNKGKKIRTKTFEFGVGELGGNNLPIVVPVISSKHPKEDEDKKNDQKASQQVPKKNKDVTKNADVAATSPGAAPNAAPSAPSVAPNVAAAAKEIDLNELTLEEARNLMHEEAKTLLLADQAKVLKEKEQALKKEEEALKAQEENLKQQAIKEAEALKQQKALMEQKKLQEKALQEEAIKVKKLKDDALAEEEKAKALLKEKKDEEEKEEKEAKIASKHVKGMKGKKGKSTKVEKSAKAEGESGKASQKGSESKISHEEWIVNMKNSPLSPLAKPAAEIQAMTIPGAAPASTASNSKPDNPAQFLYDGIGSKIAGELDKLTGKPVVPQAVPAAAQGVANACLGLCLQSCSADCPPECCGRSGFPLKNGVTAQILPIPEDLNKVIKDAGLGPGTTAQILPNEQNKHMLQQAGFADGVTARIIPIPAGYNVKSTPAQGVDSLGRSSPAEHAKLTITPPARAKAAPANKESAQPPHPPPAPMAALAARAAPQPNLNPAKVPQPAQQPPKAVSPPSAQAVQPAHAILPAQQLPPAGRVAQEASARDQGIAAIAAAAKAAKVPPPPPAKAPLPSSGTPQAVITTLAEGEKNYDESVYRELLAQLPPSVAPEDNTFVPLTVTQQLHQINVPEQAGKLRKFFKSVKTQDPFSNLEAYKRQEFKNYDEQFLVDDR